MKNILQSLHRCVALPAVAAIMLTLSAGSALAHSEQFTQELTTTLVAPYLGIQKALAADDLRTAQQSAEAFLEALVKAPAEGAAKEETDAMLKPAQLITKASDLAAAREAFLPLTQEFAVLLKHIGTTRDTPLYLLHCPMAFGNKGADWVQADKEVSNPYFGASMLRCGSVKTEIGQEGAQSDKGQVNHQSHH
jgi:hypothetical protein